MLRLSKRCAGSFQRHCFGDGDGFKNGSIEYVCFAAFVEQKKEGSIKISDKSNLILNLYYLYCIIIIIETEMYIHIASLFIQQMYLFNEIE